MYPYREEDVAVIVNFLILGGKTLRTESIITLVALVALGGFFFSRSEDTSPPPGETPPVDIRDVFMPLPSEPPSDVGRERMVSARIPAGEPLVIELIEPAASAFGAVNWTESDRAYAEILDALPFVDYDPDLGHAARELAHLYSVEDALVPSDALAFLTTSAGATVWTVRQSFTATSREGDQAILERVRALVDAEPDDGRPIRVGVGEAYEMGATPPRTIAVLLSRSDLYLDPAPRRVELGGSFVLSGSLPRDAQNARAFAMGPDLEIRDITLEVEGERFRTVLKAGNRPGPLWVELVATLPSGPMPLSQLEVQVGGAIPQRWEGSYPPDESMVLSANDAERVAATLVDMDREANGRSSLLRDPRLDAVARAHSEDMATHHFFGHRSPTTGFVGDRLKAAGYLTSGYGENVALNRSLWSAEKGLMYSLGHRKNILSTGYTHFGVGVHLSEGTGKRSYHITQVFGRPPVPIDPARDRDRLYGMVRGAYVSRGLTPPAWNGALASIAGSHAGSTEDAVGVALESARRSSQGFGNLYGWSHRVNGLDDLSIPEDAFARSYSKVGIGISQDLAGPPPTIRLIVLLAE